MKRISAFLLTLVLLAALVFPALAQDVKYRVDVNRDFGYGNGSDVRGNFSIKLFGSLDNVSAVRYRIDDQEMAALSEPPFVFKFVTGSYPAGLHSLTAVVETRDGRTVTTPAVKLNFLSAEQQASGMQKIFVPLIGLILAIALISFGAQYLTTRGSTPPARGSARNYGLKGGAICARCGRPFVIPFMTVNLLTGALARCPSCGRCGIVRRRSPADLLAAEQAERVAAHNAESGPIGTGEAVETEEERLRKLLDQSKYSE